MGRLNTYIAALPRIAAERSLQLATAVGVAWGGGKAGREAIRGWQQQVRGGSGSAGNERLDGMATLVLWKQANERARARGELWEQRVGLEPMPAGAGA